MIIVPKNIVTVDGKDRILKNHFVEIENGKIISIKKNDEKYFSKNKQRVFRFDDLTLIPDLYKHIFIFAKHCFVD